MIARLVYARSRSPASLVIQHWPDGAPARWSHLGVLVPPEPEYELGWRVWEARFGHRFGPTDYEEFRKRYSEVEVVEFEVPDLEAGYRWLEENRGRPYATWTLVGRALGRRGGEESADHCSEAGENFLDACRLRRWLEGRHLVTPNLSYNNPCGRLHAAPR